MSRECPQPKRYHSYLLRLWQEESDGQTVWRASLESAQGGQRFGFASLPYLLTFLVDRTKENGPGEEVIEV